MANLGNVRVNMFSESDDGNFSPSSRVDHPTLEDFFYGNPLKVNYLVHDLHMFNDSLKRGLEFEEGDNNLRVREVTARIISLARAYSNLGPF